MIIRIYYIIDLSTICDDCRYVPVSDTTFSIVINSYTVLNRSAKQLIGFDILGYTSDRQLSFFRLTSAHDHVFLSDDNISIGL